MNSTVIEDQLIDARVDEIRATREHGITAMFDAGDISEYAANKPTLKSSEGDRVTIISTIDGEPRSIPSLMLAKTLKKKRPDGKRAFELVDPQTGRTTGPVPEYVGGKVPCWFNPKSEKWDLLQEISGLRGFQCASESLASEFDAEMHAKNRHSRRYGVAQDAFARREREEDRAIQKASIDAMLKMAGGKAPEATPASVVYGCEQCDHEPFPTRQGLLVHKGRDHK